MDTLPTIGHIPIDDRESAAPLNQCFPGLQRGDNAYETENGNVDDFGPDCALMEPVFVPAKGATDEDDGYVMSYVFNADRNASDVVILSAQDSAAARLAVIELPVRVPFGFLPWSLDSRPSVSGHLAPQGSSTRERGRCGEMPSFFMRYLSVERLTPSRVAAP